MYYFGPHLNNVQIEGFFIAFLALTGARSLLRSGFGSGEKLLLPAVSLLNEALIIYKSFIALEKITMAELNTQVFSSSIPKPSLASCDGLLVPKSL